MSPHEALRNLDGIRKQEREYDLAKLVDALTRQVCNSPTVQDKLCNLSNSTVRWYRMVSKRRNLGTFANMWCGRCSENLNHLEEEGERYIGALKLDMGRIDGFRDIPSSLRDLPILTIIAFVAWGCIEGRIPHCRDEDKLSLVREFLNRTLQDLTELLDWKNDREWDTSKFIEDSMEILSCFVDALPFIAARNNVGKRVLDGLRQGVSRGDRFCPPNDSSCLYHGFRPDWIQSAKSLVDPSPELLAIMDDYVLSWEICRTNGNDDDQSPEAYRGCVIENVPMIRCVGLQAALLSFYKSLLPIVDDLLLSETDGDDDPAIFLDASVGPLVFSTLQTAVILHGLGKTYRTAHELVFMSCLRDDDDGSSVMSAES